MCQHEWDNKEEVFVSEDTPEEEKHQALTDGVLLADIVEGARLYAINVQSKRTSWKGDKDYTIHPQNFHDPLNRFILDAIYSKSLDMARNDL